MKPLPHRYVVRLVAGPTGYADALAGGRPALRTAPPVEYDGPGDAWSPEHLLLASVSSCFLFTFRAVARTLQAPFLAVDAHAGGIVSRVGGVTRFTDIVIRATVTAAAGATVELLQRAIDKTTAHCLVSSSLATPVRVEAVLQAAGGSRSVDERLKRTA